MNDQERLALGPLAVLSLLVVVAIRAAQSSNLRQSHSAILFGVLLVGLLAFWFRRARSFDRAPGVAVGTTRPIAVILASLTASSLLTEIARDSSSSARDAALVLLAAGCAGIWLSIKGFKGLKSAPRRLDDESDGPPAPSPLSPADDLVAWATAIGAALPNTAEAKVQFLELGTRGAIVTGPRPEGFIELSPGQSYPDPALLLTGLPCSDHPAIPLCLGQDALGSYWVLLKPGAHLGLLGDESVKWAGLCALAAQIPPTVDVWSVGEVSGLDLVELEPSEYGRVAQIRKNQQLVFCLEDHLVEALLPFLPTGLTLISMRSDASATLTYSRHGLLTALPFGLQFPALLGEIPLDPVIEDLASLEMETVTVEPLPEPPTPEPPVSAQPVELSTPVPQLQGWRVEVLKAFHLSPTIASLSLSAVRLIDDLVVHGLTPNAALADRLGISVGTLRNLVSQVRAATGTAFILSSRESYQLGPAVSRDYQAFSDLVQASDVAEANGAFSTCKAKLEAAMELVDIELMAHDSAAAPAVEAIVERLAAWSRLQV